MRFILGWLIFAIDYFRYRFSFMPSKYKMSLCAPPSPTVFELLQDLSQSMQSTSCVSQQPYLGSYGAGKVVKTMELLPGERRKYEVKTFRETTSTTSKAENVLEGFTDNSTREMESSMERENSTASTLGNSTNQTVGVTASASGKIGKVVQASASGSYNYSQNSTSNRASNVRSLGRALDKHVQTSNSNREVNINTNTTTTSTEREETITTREFENINKSRVLNIVFRQMLQEYVTITYLSNIRIGFTNGYAETLEIVELEELQTLLSKWVVSGSRAQVTVDILKHYCTVRNYTGSTVDFLEEAQGSYGMCFAELDPPPSYHTKIQGNIDSYVSGELSIGVPGVILNVQQHILNTDSVVADAVLGQGEALDCFNKRLQDAAAMKAHLENAELLQKMEIIHQEEYDKATNYKKVFGACCDTPQTNILP